MFLRLSKQLLLITVFAFASLTLLTPGFCAETESKGKIKFVFGPPNCAATQTFKTTRIKHLGVQDEQIDVGTGKVRIEYVKTPKGYSITHTPISVEATRNGKPLGDDSSAAIQKIMQSAVLTYQVDPNGQLIDILGFDKLANDMLALFKQSDPAVGKKMAAMLPKIKEAAVAKEKLDWNARIGSFAGKSAYIGDVWEAEDAIEMPLIGSYAAKSRIEMAGIVDIEGHKCLKMVYESKPDPKALTAALNMTYMQALTQTSGSQPLPKIINAKIIANGEVIIDPSNMLIYQEKFDRTSSVTVQTPDLKKADLSMAERKEFSYSYSK